MNPVPKAHEGIAFLRAARMFATEAKAEEWFIRKRWGGRAQIICPSAAKVLYARSRTGFLCISSVSSRIAASALVSRRVL